MDDTPIDVLYCLEDGTVYILKERWGYISATTGNLETKLCPSHYCRCNKETIDYLCLLDIDNQCQPNRHGRLCSQCVEGLSVVLSSEECKKCSNKWLAMLLLLIVDLSIFVVAVFYFKIDAFSGYLTLREMCPITEFFLVRIFPHSDGIQRDTKYLSVFSPNAGKYGPEKTPYLGTFSAV